jgi:hypothetical protein
MDLVQQQTISQQSTGANIRYAAIAAALVAILAAIALAVFMSGLLAGPSTDGNLGSDAWRAFRAEEHSTAVGGDPLAQQSVIDFRNSEHSEAR